MKFCIKNNIKNYNLSGVDLINNISVYNFKKGIKSILFMNPSVIGVCCGSTPDHIKTLKKLITER